MSLDDIVKGARAAKKDKKEPAPAQGKGGKAAKKEKGKSTPYDKKEKKEPKKEKKPKEKKERPPAEPSTLVYVGNLPWTVEASAVEAHFADVGKCSVDLKMRGVGEKAKPAGFALATFESIEDATKAIETLHDSDLGGRKILVRFASEK